MPRLKSPTKCRKRYEKLTAALLYCVALLPAAFRSENLPEVYFSFQVNPTIFWNLEGSVYMH
jgi:hypothetical protein